MYTHPKRTSLHATRQYPKTAVEGSTVYATTAFVLMYTVVDRYSQQQYNIVLSTFYKLDNNTGGGSWSKLAKTIRPLVHAHTVTT